MSVETHRVVIGACGWKHSAWLNDFYDEDLPEDWQLGFYSNEFPVVYVPAVVWLVVEDMDLSQWTEDVSDSFRFILELPADTLNDAAAYNAALTKAKNLGEFCLGLVLVVNQTLCDDPALLQSCIEKAKTVSMVCIDSQNVVPTQQLNDLLIENDISNVWQAKPPEYEAEAGELMKFAAAPGVNFALARVHGQNLAMPDLRKVLEACLSISNEECAAVLIFDGEPPSIEMMRNADMLLNLL